MSSNGDTPEKQVEQILALAPILPGQRRKNSIPPSHHRVPSIASSASPESSQILPPKSPDVPATIPEASPPPQANDLINFDQNESTPTPVQSQTAQPMIPEDLHLAQTRNNGQQQKELERTLRSTSKSPDRKHGPLIDFHDDIKKALPLAENKKSESTGTSAPLVREDTDSKSIDEFVDAQS